MTCGKSEGNEVDEYTFVIFADFFFDSLLADWYVQSRLKKSSEEVEDAMRQISDILEKLYAMKAEKYSQEVGSYGIIRKDSE